MTRFQVALLAGGLGALVALPAPALAQGQPAPAHAMPASDADAAGGRTHAPANASVYFVDLKDGAKVPPKLHVRIGLLNMGVSPAGVAFPGTGHNHILIDTPLPPFDEPIPADDNHIHLGGGQTEADIALTPGPHTLQLLMGDKDHVPHEPPIYSAPIHVTVAEPRTPARPGAEVYFITPHDGDVIAATSTVRFGLRGMGVAPTSLDRVGVGHHHLIIDAPTPALDAEIPADDQHLHFGGGQTETQVTLTPGRHTLQLVFADAKHISFDPPIMTRPITVTVRGAVQSRR